MRFRKMGEDGVSSFASRMTQGIFVVHHDRTGAVFCALTRNRAVRGKSWTRQPLSGAWDATKLGRLVWHSVANGGS